MDHYFTFNLRGLQQLIDLLGGISVDNPQAFSEQGVSFTQGRIHLTGDSALKFLMNQPPQPKLRQQRQQLVAKALVQAMGQPKFLAHYSDILNVLSDNVRTNLTFKDFQLLAKNYRTTVQSVKFDYLMGSHPKSDEVHKLTNKLQKR
ncbi:LCP family protein [Bombilactobacillus folatiphilus]|uniref:LCP family protein n=1 Tax=Bombilactobacillus folatiphilus TaxID=2923362 RepID=A0ABY4P7N6_9LACO|nr:LCP family protein [Bombilactobacillus folatiphilus]UQS81718.1 LCP family protein [Bombilactobacillus folatiphilus]